MSMSKDDFILKGFNSVPQKIIDGIELLVKTDGTVEVVDNSGIRIWEDFRDKIKDRLGSCGIREKF